jgi:tetratricopeptide (TPR) repeat protein
MYDLAIAEYLKAVEIDPSQTQLIFRIAQLYEFKGSAPEARGYYSEYLKRSPNDRMAEDARTKLTDLK